jgi:hypothetical protein
MEQKESPNMEQKESSNMKGIRVFTRRRNLVESGKLKKNEHRSITWESDTGWTDSYNDGMT